MEELANAICPQHAHASCRGRGLVATEDLQDFAQLWVGSFQVQTVMNKCKVKCCLKEPLLPSAYPGFFSRREESALHVF